jgi:CRP/FNR family transcriptional regulator, cyclic AMP receptor protein
MSPASEHPSITLEQIITFLLDTPMFENLDEAELSQIVQIMQIRQYRDGQYFFREGDDGDAWYVLYEGNAAVTRFVEMGPSQEIASLSPRACFGEMAIVDRQPRSATVRARGRCVVFRFPHDDFAQLLHEDNVAAYKLVVQMARVLSERQRLVNQQLSELLAERETAGSEPGDDGETGRTLDPA